MYESLIKPILFLFDPEFMHDFFVRSVRRIGNIPGGEADRPHVLQLCPSIT